MADAYYRRQDLERFGEMGEHRSELYEAYQHWSNRVMAEGALPKKTKHLIAMAVAHALQCSYCIDAHTRSSFASGAVHDEIVEAIHVAAVIRGGSSLVHGIQGLDSLEEDE
jgi:alkylhydroperoxidase/carboxymuconolactone decarboxylase family protein